MTAMGEAVRRGVGIVVDSKADTDNAWTLVARTNAIPIERGIAAIVNNEPVAIFRLTGPDGDEWYAVSHIDPVVGAPVMARGLVGSGGAEFDVPTIASPLDKRRYDLRTGRCLDGAATLRTFDVLIADGWLLVS